MKKSALAFLMMFIVISINSLAQKTWTGTTSTAWNTSTNWSPVGVPASGDNVIIPSSPVNQPLISGITTAACKNLTVDAGATLSIKGTSSNSALLTATGTVTFNGELSIGGFGIFPSITGKLVALNVIWNPTSSIDPLYGARCEVSGDWTFASGSSVNLGLCSLTFTGASNSNIYNHSNNSSFNSITLSKTGSATVYISASSSATMNINGTLNIGSGSVFNGASSITTVLKGNLVNAGNIYLNAGTLSLEKASGTQDIQINTNDYFNSVTINSGGTVTLTTTYLMQLKGSMNIQAGVLDPQNNTIALFGNWNNTAGPDAFVQGTGRVIFNGGNYHQYCSDETFSTLEINKSVGGALRVNGTDVTCSKYDWTAGAVDVLNNGTFTVSSQLLDNGIAGSFYLNSGCTINLTNLTGNIDLKGNLYIYGGNFNMYGGVNPSWWPSGGNGSITMSGGTLDFIDQGMLIRPDVSYSFAYNITGGTIRTAGNFACTRSDFNPTAGTIELYGSDDCYLIPSAGSLYNVEIDKTSGTIVDVTSDATINGSLTVNSGTMKVNNQVLTTSENIMVSNGGTLWMDQNSQLKIGTSKTLNVFSGGTLKTEGTSGNEVVVTRNGSSGNYVINITSGATIAAQRTSFYYVDPLRVHAGATIEDTYPFHYCKFRYATFGMLRIDNDQDLLLRNVEFLGPATGYNVYKAVDSGNLEFKDAYGDYSGATYEDDPYNRIDWTVTQPGLWTGVVSTSWYAGDNWDDGLVPNAATNVVIPATAPNMPVMDAGVWDCNNLDIEGTLTISGANLTANGNLTVTGTLAMNAAADILSVLGDVVWESGSQASITADASIEVYGHWNFNSGSNAQLNNGKVYFEGTTNKWIRNYSSTSRFNDIYVTKTSGAQIGFSDLSTENLFINGDLRVFANGKFVSDGGVDVILKGDLISDGTTQCNAGRLILNGSDQSIKPNTNDYFNYLYFGQTGTATINTSNTSMLNVKDGLAIHNGIFDPSNCTIKNGGDWSNWVGTDAFIEGSSRVIFNGDNNYQYCWTDETFYTLEVDKPLGGALRTSNSVPGKTVFCSEYDWTAGALDAVNGNFTATSLLDNGIAGDFYVTDGGSITLGNLSGIPHLKGNLHIYGGTFNIIAPIGSEWGGDGDASITMTDGELNVYPYGIEIIDDPSYNFTSNITGGTIRTEGSFINYRDDFNPTGGTLELYGSGNAGLLMSGGSLYGLKVDKSAENSVTVSSNVTVNGPLYVNSGTLLANGHVLTTSQNVVVQTGGTLWMDENSQLKIGASQAVTVFSGSTLRVEGSPGNEAVVTRNGASGNYVINITSGATIAAQRASFYYVDPLRVHAGATIEDTYPFHYCKFRYATFGMLRIDNDQDLLLRNVEFLGPATGYNVYKALDSGNLEFRDAYGDYSGATYENDPYNRIEWTVTQPGLWTGAVSTSWYAGDNWDDGLVPNAGTNVVIPATAPNMPVMDAGVWECNNLDIEGTLTISGANLTANGNLTVTGTLAMTSAADILSVLGDVVWESGSQASITADAAIEVYGHWNFNSGSNAQLNNGKVYFEGTTDKWIRIFSENVRFNDIYVTKTSGAQIGFSDLSTEHLYIEGDLRVFANSKFVSDSDKAVFLRDNLISDGTTQCNAGSFRLFGNNQSIKPNTNDYFNYLYFWQSGTVTINTANTSILNVNGNLTMDSGVFNAGNSIIKVGGHWSNFVGTTGFVEGTSRVVFNGENNFQQIMADETFYTLEVDKPLGGALRLIQGDQGQTVVCSEYDWTAGALDVMNGNFTATSLLDNGIAGDFYITDGGSITLGNMSGIPHLKGNLHIYGGTFNIIAPIGSEWGGDGDASITMTDGELNVYPYGIEIMDDPSYNFTSNITGGTIRTEGAFINYRDDFNMDNLTLEMVGSEDAGIISAYNSLKQIVIDKDPAATVSLFSNLQVIGFASYVYSGILKIEPGIETYFRHLYVETDGELWLTEGAKFRGKPGYELVVDGTLKVHGSPSQMTYLYNPLDSTAYNLVVQPGGVFSARYAYFSGLFYGVRIFEGVNIDPDNMFTHCTFEKNYNTEIRVHGGQDIVVVGAHFPTVTENYNVEKTNDAGSITFIDATGDFAGEAFEDDPYNRVHWIENQFAVDVKVSLEGPFNGSDMNTDLNPIIPLQQTLTVVGYNGTEEVVAIPNADVVDWIGLELRDAPDINSATESTAIGGGAFFLLKDGSIVGLDGSSVPTFNGEISQQLFVVIWHRNHLPVISAYPLTESGGIFTYDFTTAAAQAYGNNQSNLGSGKFGMYAGDMNPDGTINDLDKTSTWQIQTGHAGYLQSDVNMDGQTDNKDKNDLWYLNRENLKSYQNKQG